MRKVFLDFETTDLGLQNGIGPGWPYKGLVSVIGYCYAIDSGPIVWSDKIEDLKTLLDTPSEIIAHNMSYEGGILTMLGIDLAPHLLVDTELMAAYNGFRQGTRSLNALASYLFNAEKKEDKFLEIALLEDWKSTSDNVMIRRCKENLALIYEKYPGVVEEYCEVDVELLRKVYAYFRKYQFNDVFYSDLTKAVISARKDGVLISLEALHEADKVIRQRLFQAETELESFGPGTNFSSPKQLADVFTKNGYELPKSDKGNLKTSKEVLEALEGPLPDALRRFRKYDKLRSSFIEKLQFLAGTVLGVDQDFLPREGTFRVHPCLNILRADTGRFSSDSPNVQQLSKHDPEGRALVRGLFIPEEGEEWWSLDFSAQEIRIQALFAACLGVEGGEILAKAWQADPHMDAHTMVARLCDIDRKHAKTINLAISYGIGKAKLAKALGLDEDETLEILDRYHDTFPYLNRLKKVVEKSLVSKGYITMLSKRKVNRQKIWVDPDTGKTVDFVYKALNILIQGNAADQTSAALVHLYRNGIKFKFAVHDEICLSTKDVLEVAKTAFIMENVLRGPVPFTTGISVGPSFGHVADIDGIDLSMEEESKLQAFSRDYSPEFEYGRKRVD